MKVQLYSKSGSDLLKYLFSIFWNGKVPIIFFYLTIRSKKFQFSELPKLERSQSTGTMTSTNDFLLFCYSTYFPKQGLELPSSSSLYKGMVLKQWSGLNHIFTGVTLKTRSLEGCEFLSVTFILQSKYIPCKAVQKNFLLVHFQCTTDTTPFR